MTRTSLVVLAIELDEPMGDPDAWQWAEIIDTPLAADVVTSHITDDPHPRDLRVLAHRLLNAADHMEHEGGDR